MNNKLCGLLGIARRSGHILIGFDAVRAALLAHKTRLILLASDCSPKTEKELRFAAQDKSCPVVKVEADKDAFTAVYHQSVGNLILVSSRRKTFRAVKCKRQLITFVCFGKIIAVFILWKFYIVEVQQREEIAAAIGFQVGKQINNG